MNQPQPIGFGSRDCRSHAAALDWSASRSQSLLSRLT